MMSLIKYGQQEISNLKKFYERDFPATERKPLRVLKNAIKKGTMDCLVYRDDGVKAYSFNMVGNRYNAVLIDYLAVDSSVRGEGHGSKFLSEFHGFYKDKSGIFIEIEMRGEGKNESENIIREKRYAFYKKNGFIETDIFIYLMGEKMEIMYLPLNVQLENFEVASYEVFISCHKMTLGEKFVNNKIQQFMPETKA